MWLKSIFSKPATTKQDTTGREFVKNTISTQSPIKRMAPVAERANLLQPAKSGSNQIQYDEKLILQLKGDHAALLLMYSSVANKVSAGTWDAIPVSLRKMRTAINGHLLTEGVKLYSYMRRSLVEDQSLYDIYRSYKKEMDAIGRVVFDFFDKYQGEDWVASLDSRKSFKTEFDHLGQVLVDRITREENILYPLYLPS